MVSHSRAYCSSFSCDVINREAITGFMVRRTESTVSVLDILRRDRFAEADEHKRRRDELSSEAKNWALRRDQYRERSKDAHREALEAREERDAINLKAKGLKEKRDQIQAQAAEFKGKDKETFEKYREEARAVHEELTAVAEKSRVANDRWYPFSRNRRWIRY